MSDSHGIQTFARTEKCRRWQLFGAELGPWPGLQTQSVGGGKPQSTSERITATNIGPDMLSPMGVVQEVSVVLCGTCWRAYDLGRATESDRGSLAPPDALRHAKTEPCGVCGRPTDAGLYVRASNYLAAQARG